MRAKPAPAGKNFPIPTAGEADKPMPEGGRYQSARFPNANGFLPTLWGARNGCAPGAVPTIGVEPGRMCHRFVKKVSMETFMLVNVNDFLSY